MPSTLYRSFKARGERGDPLPLPFKALEKRVSLLQGQTSVIAAGPGVAKTALAVNFIARTNVPTLLISPDSDETTVGARLVSVRRQRTLSSVLRAFHERGEEWEEYLGDLEQVRHVDVEYRSSPSFGDIMDYLRCYEQVHGYYPRLIILDNVRNVYNDEGADGAEHQRYAATVDFFDQEIAQVTGAHCMLLHHLMGQYEDGNTPPPLSALLGKVAKQPNVVMNLFREDETTLGVVVAKNRDGRAWPDASSHESLRFNAECQTIT